jgi:SAM-dependent methyltransferase
MSDNNTTRFSNRVEDYVKYRPGYPPALLNYLQDHYHLITRETVADIGAGTGISTALFLKAGYPVFAVEPNNEMREKLEEMLNHFPQLKAINGTAENTTLPDHSVDLIVAGQAFHWFDPLKSRDEFERILKPRGRVAIIWNERRTSTPFEKEYENLILKYATDYLKIDHRNIEDRDIEKFFYPRACSLKIFDNHQSFDFEGLKGRLASSSYIPPRDGAGFSEMTAELENLFNKYSGNNFIQINYDTKLYAGWFK